MDKQDRLHNQIQDSNRARRAGADPGASETRTYSRRNPLTKAIESRQVSPSERAQAEADGWMPFEDVTGGEPAQEGAPTKDPRDSPAKP